MYLIVPQGVPMPRQPSQDRDSGVSAAVWEGLDPGSCVYLIDRRSVPIPQAVQEGKDGVGCVRRCAGVARSSSIRGSPTTASLSPRRPKLDRRDSSVSVAVREGPDPMYTCFSNRVFASRKRSIHDLRDSGVCAAVWEWLDAMHT